MKYSTFLLTSILLILVSESCAAVDAITFVGGGADSADLLRLESQWNWTTQWLEGSSGYLSGYWDLDVANWRESKWHDLPNDRKNIIEIGTAPMFRYRGNGDSGYYVDAGIGIHQLFAHYDNGTRQLSTRFEFGDIVSLGYRFVSQWEIGANFEHYSNSGISRPNSGVNFIALRLSKSF